MYLHCYIRISLHGLTLSTIHHELQTPNEAFFHKNPEFLGLGRQIQADKFWGIWGIFGQTISTHFGTVSSFSVFSIIQPLFPQKTEPLYPHLKYLFGIGI
jgi:hypothetical protein